MALVGKCEANQIAFARERFRLPGYTIHDEPFALWAHSPRPAAENLVTSLRLDEPRAQVELILQSFQRAGQPSNWVVGPSAKPDDLGKMLRGERRMMGPMHLPAMELDLRHWAGEESQVSVREIDDWEPIDAEGHPKLEWSTKASRVDTIVALKELQALGNTHCFVGYIDGWLATCVNVFLHDGVAGIYDVITKPTYRKRGGASATLNAGLRFAQERGCHTAILQAHKRSADLYTRLGFEERGIFKVFYYSRTRMEAEAIANGFRA